MVRRELDTYSQTAVCPTQIKERQSTDWQLLGKYKCSAVLYRRQPYGGNHPASVCIRMRIQKFIDKFLRQKQSTNTKPTELKLIQLRANPNQLRQDLSLKAKFLANFWDSLPSLVAASFGGLEKK